MCVSQHTPRAQDSIYEECSDAGGITEISTPPLKHRTIWSVDKCGLNNKDLDLKTDPG